MNKETRNILRNAVTEMRRKLEDAVSKRLEGHFGIHDTGKIDGDFRMGHLDDEGHANREQLLGHLEHIKSGGFSDADTVDQLKREIAFTHLNRLVAFKLMEKRGLIRQTVSEGVKSRGVEHYLAEHDDDAKLYDTGDIETAYRNFLSWQAQQFEDEIGVLFAHNDPANAVYPPQLVLDEVLTLINSEKLASIWTEDETIGWVYQYFTPKELRDKVREESQAPRNSYELAFRNQFYTPRYVVEFLTDNTLGRTWYEMHQGDTALKDHCRYLVRRPNEIFMRDGEEAPEIGDTSHLPQEELLQQPVYIPHRAYKDPRRLKILDPACGSGHFLLYCFDLLTIIYEEAWDRDRTDPIGNWNLRRDYASLDALRRDLPRLILRHNLHGIDIDRRATQIAALALWLRAQRYYNDHDIKRADRPKITQGNIVLAEPMPGNKMLLKEFAATLKPPILEQLVERVFDKMQLAGEAGSLLKIEEAIQDDIKQAKKLWETGPKPEQLALFPDLVTNEEFKQLSLFDVSAIDDVQFWTQTEKLVLEALEAYAQQAVNGKGLQRRLFAQDAAGGFAFIENLRKRFDVVLMNPPFGSAAKGTRTYIADIYPSSYQDLGMAFVTRAKSILNLQGSIGAITSRTFVSNDSLSDWRFSQLLKPENGLVCLADLGYGVLDDAMVEAASYVIGDKTKDTPIYFLDLLDSSDKATDLANLFSENDKFEQSVLVRHSQMFQRVPDYFLCYWLPERFLDKVLSLPNLSKLNSDARVGLQTGDNNRFVRTTWEVPEKFIGSNKYWNYFAKGGEYEPFYDDIHLVVRWENDGEIIKNFTDERGKQRSRPQNTQYFFRLGITYPDRTTSDFSPRIMPPGIIFSSTGFALFPPNLASILGYLGMAYTRPYKTLLEAFVGGGDSSVSGSAARHYRPGILNVLPNLLNNPDTATQSKITYAIKTRLASFSQDETTRYFLGLPQLFNCVSLRSWANDQQLEYLENVVSLIEMNYEIEKAVNAELDIDSLEDDLDTLYGIHPSKYSEDLNNQLDLTGVAEYFAMSEEALVALAKDKRGAARQLVKKSYFADRRFELLCHIFELHPRALLALFRTNSSIPPYLVLDAVGRILSYTIGSILGRWDIRFATGEKPVPDLPDPFMPLPVCSPGVLQNTKGQSATETPEGYPLDVVWDGILVDDDNHPDDIVRHIRDVLHLLWGDKAGNIEAEMLAILGEKSLRAYFRRSGNGGFWMNHVSRYSKSRRKAPIYWYLRSRNGNYGLWLYYHRLDGDLIPKALTNYVRPKVQELQHRVTALSGQKNDKKAQAEFEAAQDMLNELLDFQAKLERVIDYQLKPDLNDGVVLNIAPLHELVPWGEAASYWNELLAGKYEWSSIGKQLKAKGLVK